MQKLPYLAKSSGITLDDHTQHVLDEALSILEKRPFFEEKYRAITGTELHPILVRVAEYHDKGKMYKQWQEACRKDYIAYQNWCQLQNKNEAIPIYNEYNNKIGGGKNLLCAGLRHEFASLLWADRSNIELNWIEKIAIAAHHGKLSWRHEERWQQDGKKDHDKTGPFAIYWDWFLNFSTTITDERTFYESLNKRYASGIVRSLLQLADTRASRAESEGWLPNLEAFQYTFPHAAPKGVQQVVQEKWDESMMILRAPTGSGKTDAALLWAKHQIDNKRADRLVIAMPTRFTSNALAINIDASVSETGLYHSSAWYTKFQKDGEVEKTGTSNAKELHKLARLIQTPITVSTIDHLLISLTGTREDHHSIFSNLMNACVVIDEADFYDPFVQANLVVLLRVFRMFKVPVLIMSATVPESAKELYQIPSIVEDTTSAHIAKCDIEVHKQVEDLSQIEDILEQALTQPTIIYANTVDRALQYYEWFEKKGIKPKVYHSRFTEPDKARIESELLEMLGKKAWQEKRAFGIAIMTQIGEMSINISAPLMISDICPFDRLAQRAGRLNRFSDEIGKLHLIIPHKNNALYPAPYGEYDLRKQVWIAGEALLKTIAAVQNKCYSPTDFVHEVNLLYPDVKPFTSYTELNQKALEHHIENNWLIVPLSKIEEDSDETEKWRSRNIPPQVDVFVNIDFDTRFLKDNEDKYLIESWNDFTNLKLEHAIPLPVYELKKGIAKQFLFQRECQIDDEILTIYYTPFYDPDKGLVFNEPNSSLL